MFCQREICQQIVASGGDYLFVVKDNQPELKAAIEAEFQPGFSPRYRAWLTIWMGLAFCRLQRTTICQGQKTAEVQYAISSLSRPRADAAWLMTRGQDHGGIESLHWGRDVTFGEDKCQVRHGHAPQNLAAFRNAAISLLRLGGCKGIAATLRDFSYRPLKLMTFLGIMKN